MRNSFLTPEREVIVEEPVKLKVRKAEKAGRERSQTAASQVRDGKTPGWTDGERGMNSSAHRNPRMKSCQTGVGRVELIVVTIILVIAANAAMPKRMSLPQVAEAAAAAAAEAVDAGSEASGDAPAADSDAAAPTDDTPVTADDTPSDDTSVAAEDNASDEAAGGPVDGDNTTS